MKHLKTRYDEPGFEKLTPLEEDLLNKLTDLIRLTGEYTLPQAERWVKKMRRTKKARKIRESSRKGYE